MEALTIRELLEAVHGRLLGDFEDLDKTVFKVETDSRTISEGALFLPLTGERFDGHAYINQALEAGAAGCFTQRERESYLPGKFYIKVDSTHKALRDLAVWYKSRFDVPVVAITGSVGKTTTKDMVAAVLSEKFNVLKTEGNFNNDIGLPLTLLRLSREHQIAVLELGINHPGEMDYLSAIAQPDVVCVTNIGDAHIENFGSREVTLREKLSILNHAVPGCTAILNGDDELLARVRDVVDSKWTGSILYVGRGMGLDYHAGELESDWRSQTSCEVITPMGSCHMDIPALGEHMIYPTLMAAAVGEKFGMTLEEITAGVHNFAPTKMRMNILPRGDDITILDDSYNANPQSMRAAIEVLDGYTGEYKVAVLGDMFELGAMAPMLHAGVGQFLGRSHVDCLVAVGELAKDIYDAAISSEVPECYHFDTKERAMLTLHDLIRPGTTILVKASRGMEFEVITDYLKTITGEA
ncbi:MAG: UDP-N-acetylmuramoyl-tripeptide--D-alanyl-D-alanine ligase [Oscillospiraceae bacterium]|nr:UDP-N-acetylmuramoyl-tripeptide--D-alanyl-D-alanine ligase [Oscillospiraceae bacterium]